jgi:hypothetical protein
MATTKNESVLDMARRVEAELAAAAVAAAKKPARKRKPKTVDVSNDNGAPVLYTDAVFTLQRLAKGEGGHRFESDDEAFSPVYVDQEKWNALGKPLQIRVTIEAL